MSWNDHCQSCSSHSVLLWGRFSKLNQVTKLKYAISWGFKVRVEARLLNEGCTGLPSSKSEDLLRSRYSSSPHLNSDTCAGPASQPELEKGESQLGLQVEKLPTPAWQRCLFCTKEQKLKQDLQFGEACCCCQAISAQEKHNMTINYFTRLLRK